RLAGQLCTVKCKVNVTQCEQCSWAAVCINYCSQRSTRTFIQIIRYTVTISVQCTTILVYTYTLRCERTFIISVQHTITILVARPEIPRLFSCRGSRRCGLRTAMYQAAQCTAKSPRQSTHRPGTCATSHLATNSNTPGTGLNLFLVHSL